jgi:hypothetical protein
MTPESSATGVTDAPPEAERELDVEELVSDDGEKPAPTETRRQRRGRERRKLRARKVERIIRRIDPWSVLKVSFLFSLSLWIVFMLAGMILWTGAVSSGAIDNVEKFITDLFALKSFKFEGAKLFRGAAVGGAIMVLVSTGFSVLMAVLFNLISDLTGGIRVSVIELENLRQRPPRR